jgi:uncharacterized protein (DUF433 family)
MPREYTPQEAAALAGANLGAVQKAITTRAIDVRRKGGRRLLGEAGVYTLAIATSAPASWKIPLRDIRAVVVRLLHNPMLQAIPHGKMGAYIIDPTSVVRDVNARLALYERAQADLIERNPEILGGTPVVKGTRLNVYAIAGRLNEGETIDEMLQEYPYLTRDHIEAAQLYAKANPLRGRPGGRPWEKKRKKSRGS